MMYGEIEQTDWSASASGFPIISRGTLTPPRLRAVDPAMTQPIPRLVMADLRFPAEVVRQHATTYATAARLNGSQHSMRLWREGYEQALIALARQATRLPSDATCQALSWEQQYDEFYVSVTFCQITAQVSH